VVQAAGLHLSIGQQVMMILTLLISSKGTAGVARASLLIVLAWQLRFTCRWNRYSFFSRSIS